MEIHSVTSAEFASRLGCSSGMNLKKGVTECKYKTSTKTYPLISRDHVLAFDWLTAQEWEEMMDSVKRANDILQGFFKALGMTIFSINSQYKCKIHLRLRICRATTRSNYLSFVSNGLCKKGLTRARWS